MLIIVSIVAVLVGTIWFVAYILTPTPKINKAVADAARAERQRTACTHFRAGSRTCSLSNSTCWSPDQCKSRKVQS